MLKLISAFAALEAFLIFIVFWLRQSCPWIITRRDCDPVINPEGLQSFISHGWDKELGWVRKPNSHRQEAGRDGEPTSYNINSVGARTNPDFETQPIQLLAYGDSYTFARQVNDDEAWPHTLSIKLDSNVANFGVGNYGMDQALLRLEREYKTHPAPVIIMGVVPETICRLLAYWKHFSEYGNTLAFKPKFTLEEEVLKLLANPIDDPQKFHHIKDYFDVLAANDYFYETKFCKDMLTFPFTLSLMRRWNRNSKILIAALGDRLGLTQNAAFTNVMKRNIDITAKLYADPNATRLFHEVAMRFARFCRSNNAAPILIMMPQLLDMERIKNGDHYYKKTLDALNEDMTIVDMAPILLNHGNVDELFINDIYGGHFSVLGNSVVAEILAPICRELLQSTTNQQSEAPEKGLH